MADYTANQERSFYMTADLGSVPATCEESGTAYFAFAPLTAGAWYDFRVTAADIRCRVATFAAEPTGAGQNGIRTVCAPQVNPAVGFNFRFAAAEGENVLAVYGGVASDGAQGTLAFTLEEIQNPHDYNSVQDIVNAGTANMTALISGGSYDDNTYTISDPPAWLKFNGALSSAVTVSGNTWFGITTTGEQIKFNRRDTKMTDLYCETGTLYNHYNFYKLRWCGYSAWNQASDSYRQIWEIIFFDTGSFMLNAVTIPASCYDGTCEVIASQTYGYTKPTAAAPYVSFYAQDEECATFEISYEIIDIPLPYTRKYLLKDGSDRYYTVVTEGSVRLLEEITVTELTPEVFEESGFDLKPDGSLLMQLTNPTMLFWQDSDNEPPTFTVTTAAVPPAQTVITANVQMLDSTILAIESVEIDADDATLFAVSFDGGTTWKGYVNDEWVVLTEPQSGVSKATLEAIGSDAWAEQCTDRQYRFRFVLFENGYVNSIVIHYIN